MSPTKATAEFDRLYAVEYSDEVKEQARQIEPPQGDLIFDYLSLAIEYADESSLALESLTAVLGLAPEVLLCYWQGRV